MSDAEVILNKLKSLKDELISLYAEESHYKVEDIEILWKDLEIFLDNFDELLNNTKNLWKIEEKIYNKWQRVEILRVPWGRILYFAPSNAIIPLLPIVSYTFTYVGNELILVPSRKTIKTAMRIYDIINPILGYKLKIFTQGGKAALEEYVKSRKVDLVYFQGSSKNRLDIYTACLSSNIEVFFEGEGNTLVVIDDTINSVEEVTRIIFESKLFCNGQLCTSPNIVFIQDSIFDLFIDNYKKMIQPGYCVRLINPYIEKELKKLLIDLRSKTKNWILSCEIENSKGIPLGFFVLHTQQLVKEFLNREIFSPILLVTSYKDYTDFLKLIQEIGYDYGLQVSIFSKRKEIWQNKLTNVLKVFRITWNLMPIYQNSLLPWGGYKRSGYSFPENFLNKALRKVLIETGGEK